MKTLSIKQAIFYSLGTVWRHLIYFVGALTVTLLVNTIGLFAFLGINWPTIRSFIGRLPEVCGFMFNETAPDGQALHVCISSITELFSTNWFLYSFLFVAGFIVVFLISSYMMLGWFNALLYLYDHNKGSIRALFVSFRLLMPFVIALILYSIIVLLGTIALIIPGIILAIKFGMFMCVLVDKNVGVIESFRESSRITYGAKWRLFLLSLTLGVIGLVAGFVMTMLTHIVVSYKIAFMIAAIADKIVSGYLYTTAVLAGIYAYRTLNAQTYAPTRM